MRKSALTNTATAAFDDVLVRNPPYSGNLVSVTSLGSGGGGASYDDTQIRTLIAGNTAVIATKQAAITIQDSGGTNHTNIMQINCAGGTVTSNILSLPVQQGPAGQNGVNG